MCTPIYGGLCSNSDPSAFSYRGPEPVRVKRLFKNRPELPVIIFMRSTGPEPTRCSCPSTRCRSRPALSTPWHHAQFFIQNIERASIMVREHGIQRKQDKVVRREPDEARGPIRDIVPGFGHGDGLEHGLPPSYSLPHLRAGPLGFSRSELMFWPAAEDALTYRLRMTVSALSLSSRVCVRVPSPTAAGAGRWRRPRLSSVTRPSAYSSIRPSSQRSTGHVAIAVLDLGQVSLQLVVQTGRPEAFARVPQPLN